MTTVTLQDLAETDHDAWMPLWRGYQTFYQVDLSASVSATTWARLLDPAESMHGALAVADGVAIGLAHWLTHRFTWSDADLCYLNDLFVVPDRRGGGVGRLLIEHVYATAAAAGCKQVYWLTHETNTTAQQLYNRLATRTGFIHYSHTLVSGRVIPA